MGTAQDVLWSVYWRNQRWGRGGSRGVWEEQASEKERDKGIKRAGGTQIGCWSVGLSGHALCLTSRVSCLLLNSISRYFCEGKVLCFCARACVRAEAERPRCRAERRDLGRAAASSLELGFRSSASSLELGRHPRWHRKEQEHSFLGTEILGEVRWQQSESKGGLRS